MSGTGLQREQLDERKTQESKSATVYTQDLSKYGTANLKDPAG